MPEFAMVCQNRHRYDSVHSMKGTDQHPACKCGAPAQVDWTRQNAPRMPAHDLHGTREVCQDVQMQPREVPRARELFGAIGSCIQNDGSVKFKNRSEAGQYFAKEKAIEQRFADQKAAGKLKTRKQRRMEKAFQTTKR